MGTIEAHLLEADFEGIANFHLPAFRVYRILKHIRVESEWIPLLTNSTHCNGPSLLQIPRLLKRKRHLQHTPIVVISSHNLYPDRQPALRVCARH